MLWILGIHFYAFFKNKVYTIYFVLTVYTLNNNDSLSSGYVCVVLYVRMYKQDMTCDIIVLCWTVYFRCLWNWGMLQKRLGTVNFFLCSPIWHFFTVITGTALFYSFFRVTYWSNLTFLDCFLFTQAIIMVCYFPRFPENGFTLLSIGCHLLSIQFISSVMPNLSTVLTRQNTTTNNSINLHPQHTTTLQHSVFLLEYID